MKILYLPNHYSQQRQREKKARIYPVRMAMEAEYYKQRGHAVFWECSVYNADLIIKEPQKLPFPELPIPDREFSKAKKYTSGNYKHLPGTHILSACGCPWGKCSFCVENKESYYLRPVNVVLKEIEDCYRLGFREVFDDAATLATGKWLDDLCKGLIGIPVKFSANFRAIDYDYEKLHNAGFRMLLFGIESANQITLNLINKGIEISDIRHIIKAALSGIDVHIAYMVSYPWETLEEEMNTIRTVQWLLKKGYAKTAQCSVYTPPNGKDWRKRAYLTKELYKVAKYPEFWFNQLKELRTLDDWKYLIKKIKEGVKGLW